MVAHHSLIYLLFLAVVASLAVLDSRDAGAPLVPQDVSVPAEAARALEEGRYLRAGQIMRTAMAARPDTAPSAFIAAARAAAGSGDWERVRQLLQGRSWLDQMSQGYGWSLLGRSQIELGQHEQGSASLARFVAVADTGHAREKGVALLRQAATLTEQKKHAGALAAYEQATTLLPEIRDWIRVFAASAAAVAGDTTGVRSMLAGVDSLLANEWSWRTMARARLNANDSAGALRAAEQAAARVSTGARRAAAWTLVGSLRADAGNAAGARTAYTRAIEVAQNSTAAIEPARALSELGAMSVDHQLLVGRVYLRHGNVSRGVAGVRAYLDAGRGTAAERQQLRYDIANAYFNAGEYRSAERALLAVAEAASNRRLASDATYTAARSQYRDGRQSVARTTLQRIIRVYADQPAAVRAAYLSADLAHDDENLERATEYYRQVIRLAPASDHAALARMRLGGIEFAAGRYSDALREFDEYRTTHRSGRAQQQATYWSARALAKLDRKDEARQRLIEVRRLDPLSYYGGLAAAELEDESRIDTGTSPPIAAGEDQVAKAFANVALLREIGWEEAAQFEGERLRARFGATQRLQYALAEQLNEHGFTTAGIALGHEIFRREGAWNPRLMRIVYPFPFRSTVVAEARERGVDPFLAAALIRQESMFNPRARSAVGALGLMQVMPLTGQSLARGLGVQRFQADMLLQPEINIQLGMAYLADQLESYGDRVDAVLAAYNAGPHRVTRWQQFPEYRDRRLFAERIPFDETRDYVRIVQNNRRIYAALYRVTSE